MHRFVAIAGVFFALSVVVTPIESAVAVTAKDKKATCEFGAKDQNLKGKERADFIKKCMSNKNDPRGTSPQGAPANPAAPGAPKPQT